MSLAFVVFLSVSQISIFLLWGEEIISLNKERRVRELQVNNILRFWREVGFSLSV